MQIKINDIKFGFNGCYIQSVGYGVIGFLVCWGCAIFCTVAGPVYLAAGVFSLLKKGEVLSGKS